MLCGEGVGGLRLGGQALKGLRETGELGVAAARDAQDLHTLRLNLINLSTVHSAAGDFRKTARLCEEGLRIVRSQEDRRGEGSFLDQLGWAHGCLGDLHEGRRHLREAVEAQRAIGDQHREAFALGNLSSLHIWLGETADAVATARQSARLQQQVGAHQPQTAALNDLAVAHLAGNDPASARTVLDEALRVGEKSSMPRNLALTHALMADLCQREGRGERAPALAARALELVAPWAPGPGSARSRTSPGSSTGGAGSTATPSKCTGAPFGMPPASSSASRSPAPWTVWRRPPTRWGTTWPRRTTAGARSPTSTPCPSRTAFGSAPDTAVPRSPTRGSGAPPDRRGSVPHGHAGHPAAVGHHRIPGAPAAGRRHRTRDQARSPGAFPPRRDLRAEDRSTGQHGCGAGQLGHL